MEINRYGVCRIEYSLYVSCIIINTIIDIPWISNGFKNGVMDEWMKEEMVNFDELKPNIIV